MDVRRAGLVRFLDQEVHEADDRRLVGEVAGVGERRVAALDPCPDHAVEIFHQFDHRLGGRVGAADAVQQLFFAYRKQYQRDAEGHLEVVEDLDRGLAGDGDAELPLGNLEGEDAVEFQVVRVEGIGEGELGDKRCVHRGSPGWHRLYRRQRACRAGRIWKVTALMKGNRGSDEANVIALCISEGRIA